MRVVTGLSVEHIERVGGDLQRQALCEPDVLRVVQIELVVTLCPARAGGLRVPV